MLKSVKRLTWLTGEGKGWRRENGARDKVTEKERERGSGMWRGPGTLSYGGRALLGYLCREPQSF